MHISIMCCGGMDDYSPYGGAEGFTDNTNQYVQEMMLNQDWKRRFADEIDDHPARDGRGYIRQAGTSGIIPGFQG